MMKLNSNGKLAKFYMWLPPKDGKLPEDFCTFFWGLVGRVFIIFGMGGVVLILLCFGIYFAALWMWTHRVFVLFALGIISLTALGVWYDERKEKNPEKKIKIELLSELNAIIKGKVDSVKKRYCPRIDWK